VEEDGDAELHESEQDDKKKGEEKRGECLQNVIYVFLL
jgi:hypothetical protein